MNIINTEIKDFIGIYRNVYPEGYCQHIISEFDRMDQNGAALSRLVTEDSPKHKKNDLQIIMSYEENAPSSMESFKDETPLQMFFKGLQNCFEHYTNEFSLLRDAGNLRGTMMKTQKTSSGGGYHIWHAEQGGGSSAARALVYMLYLNTIPTEACGETEFLYQQRRIAPVENTMVIWPAGFTHAHRGNAVYGDVAKYIITGWFYYD